MATPKAPKPPRVFVDAKPGHLLRVEMVPPTEQQLDVVIDRFADLIADLWIADLWVRGLLVTPQDNEG
jgi:hypothetical protein